MKVVMLNGSSHPKGCTYTALTEVGKTLNEAGIEYEIVTIGNNPVRDCIGCNYCLRTGQGCVFKDDAVNAFVEKAREADGFVFGSPVYFAHPSGRLLSFLDRVFYSCGINEVYAPFAGKPGAAVVSARRGGTTNAVNAINEYFGIACMPIVTSTYWNQVHGNTPEEVKQDLEGLQTMRNIGRNMAYMIKARAKQEQEEPFISHIENTYQTNFIH